VAVHEFGHFSVAKLMGIRVNEFAIGMGPVLWKRRRGETEYTLRAVPMGGFCAMESEDEASGDPRAFTNAAPWKRALVLVAGAAMNFLVGLLMILLLYAGTKSFVEPVVVGFMDGFQAQGETGLMEGDRILEIDGERVYIYSDVSLLLDLSDGESVDLVVQRGGEKVFLNDLPLTLHEYTEDGQTVLRYGLYFKITDATIGMRLKEAWLNAVDFVRLVRISLTQLLTGKAGVRDMSGPIGIVDTLNDIGEESATVAEGLQNVLYIASLIAVNLAVMNLLPLPALDGGRIFLLVVTWLLEKILRRKIDPKYEGYIHAGGLILLLGLMAVVSFSDIAKIVSRFL